MVVFAFSLLVFAYSLGFYEGKKGEGYRIDRVVDGDTLGVTDLRTNRMWRMRLWGIDAPEAKECKAKEAKEELEKLVGGVPTNIQVLGVDGFGRLIGRVFLDNGEAALLLVSRGMAKVDSSEESVYEDRKPGLAAVGELRRLEEIAKKEDLGIWSKECQKK